MLVARIKCQVAEGRSYILEIVDFVQVNRGQQSGFNRLRQVAIVEIEDIIRLTGKQVRGAFFAGVELDVFNRHPKLSLKRIQHLRRKTPLPTVQDNVLFAGCELSQLIWSTANQKEEKWCYCE